MNPLLIALTVIAGISPLLTFTYLWQLKEWRIDRLRAHLRAEGIFRQLFGIVRPLIAVMGIGVFFIFDTPHTTFAVLLVMTLINALQIVFRRQPCPVWTQKAITLLSTTMLLMGAIALFITQTLSFNIALTILPLLQSFLLFLSWLLWFPVDNMLKRHICEEARSLRATHPDLIVIGITGSVGKTTTKALLAHMLADQHPLTTPEHMNTEMGVAKWLLVELVKKNPAILIVEMGAYKKGEIKTLCSIVQPTIGIITWIGKQHMELFGSEKAIAEAKGELFASLPTNGQAFIAESSPFVEEIVQRSTCPVQRVNVQSAYQNTDVHGSTIALASAAAFHLGIPQEEIDKRIATFTPPLHTFTIRKESGLTILDDTHNSSPESFQAVIAWAKNQPQSEKILLAAGIIELGSATKKIHEELGYLAAPIFQKAIILNKRSAIFFEKGFQKGTLHTLPIPFKVPPHALLVCIGRIPEHIIQNMLP